MATNLDPILIHYSILNGATKGDDQATASGLLPSRFRVRRCVFTSTLIVGSKYRIMRMCETFYIIQTSNSS